MQSLNNGIFLDGDPSKQKPGTTRKNKNIVFDAIEDFLVNEESNAEHLNLRTISPYLVDYSIPVGFISIDEDRGILFTVADNGGEAIGILSKGGLKYDLKLCTHGALAFTTKNRVYGTFRYNAKHELIVTFWDNNVETKIVNLDTPGFESGINATTKRMVDETEINSSFLYQSVKRPLCELISVNQTGGILRTGSYQIFVVYKDKEYTKTNYMIVSDIIQITDERIIGANDILTYDGSLPDVGTTKSATIELTEMDDRYSYISIGIVSRINGIVEANIVAEDLTFTTSLTYTITGFESLSIVVLEELLTDRVSYKKNKTGLQFNKALYLGNMTGLIDVGYQKYANNIQIDLDIHQKALDSVNDSFKNEVVIYFDKGLMPSEVYAFYIQFELNDGTLSYNYPIPGREVKPISFATSGINSFNENAKVSDILAGIPGVSYLYYDQSINDEVRWFQTRDTAFNTYAPTNMGFWENQNEFYPATGDDWEIWEEDPTNQGYGRKKVTGTTALWGLNVRHHKIPCWDTINNEYGSSKFLDNINRLYGLIGIKVKNIFIPTDIESQVRRYRITYAKRQYANSMVMDQTIPFFNFTYAGATHPAIAPYEIPASPNMTSVNFYPFSLLLDKPQLMATFMVNQCLYINGVVTLNGSYYRRYQFGDQTVPSGINVISALTYAYPEYRLRKITDPKYIAWDINDPVLINDSGQEAVYYNINNANIAALPSSFTPSTYYGTYYAWLSSLCIWREDCYLGFDKQEIAASPIWFKVDHTVLNTYTYDTSIAPERRYDILLGFDTYTCKYAHRTTRALGTLSSVTEFYCNSRFNIDKRNEGDEYNQKYYPKTDWLTAVDGTAWIARAENNYFAFNNDYNALNDLGVSISNPKDNQNITDFNNRVIRSAGEDEEFVYENWKVILANQYYDLPRDKGSITSMRVLADTILINTTRSLFRTIGKKELSMNELTVYIGAGDVFSQMPTDFSVGDEATLGTKSQGSMCPSPAGLFYVNDIQGRAFIVGEKPIEISSFGMKNFWKENMKILMREQFKEVQSDIEDYFNFDNSIKGVGYTSVYDQRYERLIVTKRDAILKDGYTFGGNIDDPTTLPNVDNYVYVAGGNLFLRHMAGYSTVIDIWNSVAFEDKSITLSYNLRRNIWSSFHDYKPALLFSTDVSLYSSEHDYKVYIHNVKDSYGFFYGQKYDSVIEVVGVDKNDTDKLFLTMVWSSYVKERVTGVDKYDETITDLVLYNSKQCSGEIALTNQVNIRKIKGFWRCNSFRDMILDYAQPFMTTDNVVDNTNIDLNKVWYKQNRFRDKYVIAQMIFDNESKNKLMVGGFDFYIQPAMR